MIVNSNETKAVLTGNMEVTRGSISLNKETFGLIIKGIYEDKVLASCREPIFNAVDSHVESGRGDVPIIIHSPTDLEPYFFVQDVGLGMSEEMVRNTFMNLGESTKRNSNALVGNKGVGSKAPFSMVDTFDVISVHNGVESTYLLFLDQGIPNVTKIRERKTEEHNGVKVQFHVKKEHVLKYRTAIASCLRYAKFPFTVTDPMTSKMLEGDKVEAQYHYEKDGWKMTILKGYTSSDESRVVMGHQPYRSKFLETLTDYPAICVEIPIGDCNINPGREWTIEGHDDGGFQDRLEAFVKEGIRLRGAEVVAELETAKTSAEAREMMKNSGVFGHIFGKNFMWDRWEETGLGDLGDCEIFAGGLNKGRIGYARYGKSEFLRGVYLVFNDGDGKYNRNKCNYLSEITGRNVFYCRNTDLVEEFKEAAHHPFFADTVKLLSELPRRPAKKGETKTHYEPGYWVKKLEKDGYFRRERITKAEFKKIKHCIPYEGDIQRGSCWLGQLSNIYQQNYDRVRAALQIPEGEDLYLVSESRLLWTNPDCQYVTEKNVEHLLKEDAWKFLLTRAANETSYDSLYRQLGKIIPMQDFGNYRPHFHKWEGNTAWKHSELNHRAKILIANRVKCGKAYIARLEKKYPLLKHVGLKYWDTPAMIEYRELIDTKNNIK